MMPRTAPPHWTAPMSAVREHDRPCQRFVNVQGGREGVMPDGPRAAACGVGSPAKPGDAAHQGAGIALPGLRRP